MANFSELLDKPLDDVKRPPSLPAGTYGAIIKQFEPTESGEKKTPGIKFHFHNLSPGADIDPSDLVDSEGAPINLAAKQLSTTFWLTPDSEYRLKEFIESLGVDTKGKTYKSILPDTINQSVVLDVVQKMNQKRPMDPPFNEVREAKGAQ